MPLSRVTPRLRCEVLTEESHQERCLSRSSLADDEIDPTPLEEHLVLDLELEVAPLERRCQCTVGVLKIPRKRGRLDANQICVWSLGNAMIGCGRGRLRRKFIQQFALPRNC